MSKKRICALCGKDVKEGDEYILGNSESGRDTSKLREEIEKYKKYKEGTVGFKVRQNLIDVLNGNDTVILCLIEVADFTKESLRRCGYFGKRV